MAITKKTLQYELDVIDTLVKAYKLFEDTDVGTATAIAERIDYEVRLLISGSIDWIRRYRNNDNAIAVLNDLEDKLYNGNELYDPVSVVLNITGRTVNFVTAYIFDKKI